LPRADMFGDYVCGRVCDSRVVCRWIVTDVVSVEQGEHAGTARLLCAFEEHVEGHDCGGCFGLLCGAVLLCEEGRLFVNAAAGAALPVFLVVCSFRPSSKRSKLVPQRVVT
jgi:hypothetical protein